MKLLILTQKVDINDDVLGFMHGWIAEFAKHCEKVTVICLQKGEYDLPENVKVLSLGKEEISQKSVKSVKSKVCKVKSKLLYCFNFYRYIWQERKNYDKVFVHMNAEYVVLGGLLWRLYGKKIGFWYNHLKGNIIPELAGMFADNIFYTSTFSYFAKHSKAKKMPAGIDTDIFKRDEKTKKTKNSILYLGRISLIKNIGLLIKAANELDKRGINFILNIVGEAPDKESDYIDEIKKLAKLLEEKGKLLFKGNVPNIRAAEIFNENEIFVNLTNSGSFDKTIIEAMACETPVIVSNESFVGVLSDNLIFRENDLSDLTNKLIKIINLNKIEKENIGRKMRAYAMEKQSLRKLIEKLKKLL